MHEVRHDLESFFWLLIWLVLRHTTHNDAQGNLACSSLFDGDTDAICASRKSDFLARRKRLAVRGNEPLSQLINEYRKLCKYNDSSLSKFKPLTYARVLHLFKKALDSKDWPKNDDRARPFLLPKDDGNDGVSFPSGSRRHESNIRSSQIASDRSGSREVKGASHAGRESRPRRSIPPPTENLGSSRGGRNATTAASSSRSRKRSREQLDASDTAGDLADGGSKRTRTDSSQRRRVTGRGRKRLGAAYA